MSDIPAPGQGPAPAQRAVANLAAFVFRPAIEDDRVAVVALLSSAPHLEVAFDPAAFHVAERGGQVVACGRLRRLSGQAAELASVAVAPALRASGIGRRLVQHILATAPPRSDVYALALAPGFFIKLGFQTIPEDRLHAALLPKATGMCRSTGFVPMVRRGGA